MLQVSHEEVISGKAASSFTVGLKRRTSNIATKEDMCGQQRFNAQSNIMSNITGKEKHEYFSKFIHNGKVPTW